MRTRQACHRRGRDQPRRADPEHARDAGAAFLPLRRRQHRLDHGGVNNNGLHSANAITALFIATGQDVANVAESSAGIIYTELTDDKDLYISITIPSLIVATYGGGTGLPTQHECLSALGCVGKGKVYKFAEIVAGGAGR
ncbi:MAG: hypothetical protein R2873_14540 [Caldilineaceae bacterium]